MSYKIGNKLKLIKKKNYSKSLKFVRTSSTCISLCEINLFFSHSKFPKFTSFTIFFYA